MQKKEYDLNILREKIANKETIISIAKQIGVSREWLGEYLKKNGIYQTKSRDTYDIDRVINRLKNNETVTDIAIDCGIDRTTLSLHLKQIGITRENIRIDHNFFTNIDNEIKAYWLGFIMADGCVFGGKRLDIGLHERDREHVALFCDHIKYIGNIIKYDDRAVISCYSKKICQDLIKLGCTPRKSLTLKFPSIREDLIRHCIRGYIDGDGCYYFNKKAKSHTIHIVGTKDFLLGIQNHLNINKKMSNPTRAYRLDIGGNNQVKKVINYLYKDSTVYLKRKYDKIKHLLEITDEI